MLSYITVRNFQERRDEIQQQEDQNRCFRKMMLSCEANTLMGLHTPIKTVHASQSPINKMKIIFADQ